MTLAWGLVAVQIALAATTPARPVLAAGTAVPLELAHEVSSRTHGQGNRIALRVADDVLVDGRIVIPRGAPGLAEVLRHRAKGAFGRAGLLELRLLNVQAGGRLIRLDGKREHAGRSGATPALASGIVVSAVLGSIIKGKHATLPAGTSLTGYVHRDLAVEPLSLIHI